MKRILSFALAMLMILSVQLFISAEDQKTVWEFNTAGDLEGWTFGNAEGTVAGGYLNGTAKPNSSKDFQSYDPAISISNTIVDASVYKYIQVSMKHEMKTKDSSVIKVYFKANDLGLDEKRAISVAVKKSSDGKFVDYAFNMGANAEWTGTIKGFRIDPFDDDGSFSIDSIKLLKEAPAGATTSTTTTTPTTPAEKNYFPETNKFSPTTFSDISYSAWYYASVSTAYKIGLMNGKSEKTFEPDGQVTVAEAITLATRVNEIYNGRTGKLATTDPWYQAYVDAAVKAGIITSGQFSDYTAPITRADMGVLFAKALPDDYYTAINQFKSIPDIASTNVNFNSILKLYNSGIITGVDDAGNYNPNANITRKEVATIITRVALKSSRQRKLSAEEIEAKKIADEKAKEEEAKKAEEAKQAAAQRAERVKATAINYDFSDGQLGKFSLGNCEDGAAVKDGFLNATAKVQSGGRYDPIVYIPVSAMDLSKYQVIRVGMKWSSSGSIATSKPNLFFTTVADDTWTATKCISSTTTLGANSSDKVVEFTFNCYDNATWTGTLKQIRFDPYDAAGTFSVDYIVFEEK